MTVETVAECYLFWVSLMLSVADCNYAECRYAECRGAAWNTIYTVPNFQNESKVNSLIKLDVYGTHCVN